MIQLHLACNDYRNGNHTGYVDHIQIDSDGIEPALSLTGLRVRCKRSQPFLRIGHLSRLTLLGYVTWCGNWCWDRATVSTDDAVKVANYLKRRGWHCESGWSETFAKWESGESFVADDFRESLDLEKENVT